MRIGLTGGIGSGKSTVARLLEELGAVLVDTDAIARSMTAAGGAAIGAIAQAFGHEILTAEGALDRARMRERVFADPAQRRRLEGILHPLIGQECERQSLAGSQSGAPVVFDVPLLVESGRWRARVDRVLVVDAMPQTQVQRVMARSAWTQEAVRLVIDQQSNRRERRAAADAVIFNEGVTIEHLRSEVDQIWRRWTQSQTATR